jgi:hypothetical protein
MSGPSSAKGEPVEADGSQALELWCFEEIAQPRKLLLNVR